MSLRNDYAADMFSFLYIEEEVWDHPRTKAIVDRFPQDTELYKIMTTKFSDGTGDAG